MLPTAWESVDKNAIERLISDRVPEDSRLEYKEQLTVSSDADKKEFLADVSSFANAAGGDVIFGISEERDASGKPTNIPSAALGLAGVTEADRTRLESIIVSGCAPRLSVQMKLVPGFPNGPVLVVRIPRSWSGPHMVTFQNLSRFFSRNGTQKSQLDVQQIRAGFAQTESLSDRIRMLRIERLGRIVGGDAPKQIADEPAIILHLVPYVAFNPGFSIDIRAAHDDALLRPIGATQWNRRYNLDGAVAFVPTLNDYTQIFRNGVIEAVMVMGRLPVFSAGAIEQYTRDSLSGLCALQAKLGISSPTAVLLTIVNVRGLKLEVPSGYFSSPFRDYTVDRNELMLPDIVLEAATTQFDVAMKPAYDALWQSGGFDRSPNYDDQGRRRGR
jgi:hypothetical protein